MKRGKSWLVFALWLCAATVSQAGLLDEVIRKPGTWNQMCSMPQPLDFNVPLPMYGLATSRFYYLSQANLSRLREQRATVEVDIVNLLDRMDLSKATNSAGSSSFTDSNQDPEQLNATLLDIILQLDVVEALPGLLRVEADLNERLAGAAKDGETSLPALDLGSPVMDIVSYANPNTEVVQHRKREFAARVYQREMLSVMAALLRHERYQPLLDSDLEAKYFEHLKQGVSDQQLASIHAAGDIPNGQESWIGFDPIHGLPFRKGQFGASFVPYTPELRLEIRKWAADYLQQKSAKEAASNVVK